MRPGAPNPTVANTILRCRAMVGFRALFTEDREAPSSHPKKLRGLLPLLMEATGH